MEVWCILDRREAEGLSEQRVVLSQYLVNIQTDSTIHQWLAFITTGSSAELQVQQGGMSKSEMGLWNLRS